MVQAVLDRVALGTIFSVLTELLLTKESNYRSSGLPEPGGVCGSRRPGGGTVDGSPHAYIRAPLF